MRACDYGSEHRRLHEPHADVLYANGVYHLVTCRNLTEPSTDAVPMPVRRGR